MGWQAPTQDQEFVHCRDEMLRICKTRVVDSKRLTSRKAGIARKCLQWTVQPRVPNSMSGLSAWVSCALSFCADWQATEFRSTNVQTKRTSNAVTEI